MCPTTGSFHVSLRPLEAETRQRVRPGPTRRSAPTKRTSTAAPGRHIGRPLRDAIAAQKLSPGGRLLDRPAVFGGTALKVVQLALAQLVAVSLGRERIVGLSVFEHVVDDPGQLVGRSRGGVL